MRGKRWDEVGCDPQGGVSGSESGRRLKRAREGPPGALGAEGQHEVGRGR